MIRGSRRDELDIEEQPVESWAFPLTDFYCSISMTALVKPLIGPDGSTYSQDNITEWLLTSLTSPATGLELKSSYLRNNKLVAQILNSKPVATPDGVFWVTVPVALLKNSRTGNFFINPVVNDKGNTVEMAPLKNGTPNPYTNFIIKKIIGTIKQREAIVAAERKGIPLATPARPPSPHVPLRRGEGEGYGALDDVEGEVAVEPDAPIPPYVEALLLPGDPQLQGQADRRAGEPIEGRRVEVVRAGQFGIQAARLEPLTFSQNLAGGCVFILGTGIVAACVCIAVFWKKKAPSTCTEPKPPRTFSASMPWETGGQLCIQNNEDIDVLVKTVRFFNLVSIAKPADIWGTLAPYGCTTTQTVSSGSYVHLITEPAGIKIPAHGALCATYNYDPSQTKGVVQGVGMIVPSENLAVELNDQPIPLEGICYCCANPVPGYSLMGWYPSWTYWTQGFSLSSLPTGQNLKINELTYAFLNFSATTGQVSSMTPSLYSQKLTRSWGYKKWGASGGSDSEQFTDLWRYKTQNPFLKTFIAFGGYCTGQQFNTLWSNPSALKSFASNVSAATQQLQVDGVVMDPEWWGESQCVVAIDPQGFSNFFKEVRAAVGPSMPLYLAASGSSAVVAGIPQSAWCDILAQNVKFMVMAYDLNGAWQALANTDASIALDPDDPTASNPSLNTLTVTGAMQAYQNLSCYDPQYFTLGATPNFKGMIVNDTELPYYGLYQSVLGASRGQWDSNDPAVWTGGFTGRCARAGECGGGIGLPADTMWVSSFSNATKQDFGSSDSGSSFYTGQNSYSMEEQICFVRCNGLNGSSLWDLFSDIAMTNPDSLVCSQWEGLRGATSCVCDNSSVLTTSPEFRFGEWQPQTPARTYENSAPLDIGAAAVCLIGLGILHCARKSLSRWWNGQTTTESAPSASSSSFFSAHRRQPAMARAESATLTL